MSYLHEFSVFQFIFFFLEKSKCMLQSKESVQFDNRRPTHVLVGVSGFRREKNALRSKSRKKRKKIKTEDNNIDSLQKKLKLI